MAIDDVVGVHIVGRYQSQNIVNTLHYQITQQTVTDHMILDQLAQAWNAAFTAAWVARHIDTYTMVGIKFFSVTGANKRPGIIEIDTAGSVVGEEVPSPVCRVITLYTDSDNFRKRGRLMLSGTAVSMLNTDDGAVTDTERTALTTLADLCTDQLSIDDEGCGPVLPATATASEEAITATLVRKTPACIRSRRVRGFNIG